MAYLGQKTTKPAYYDDTLQGTYFRDDESADMLDIIFASRVYDVGVYYKIGGISSKIARLYVDKSSSFQQIYTSNQVLAEQVIKSINSQFAD